MIESPIWVGLIALLSIIAFKYYSWQGLIIELILVGMVVAWDKYRDYKDVKRFLEIESERQQKT